MPQSQRPSLTPNEELRSECLDLFQKLTLKQAREKAYLNGEDDTPLLDSDPDTLERTLKVLRHILLTTPS